MDAPVAPDLLALVRQALRDIGDGFVVFRVPGLAQEVEVPRRLFRPARTEQRVPYAQALVFDDRSLVLEVAGDVTMGGGVRVPEAVDARLYELGFRKRTAGPSPTVNYELFVDDAEQGAPVMAAALAAWGVRGPDELVLEAER